jgi:hypothetical protein
VFDTDDFAVTGILICTPLRRRFVNSGLFGVALRAGWPRRGV